MGWVYPQYSDFWPWHIWNHPLNYPNKLLIWKSSFFPGPENYPVLLYVMNLLRLGMKCNTSVPGTLCRWPLWTACQLDSGTPSLFRGFSRGDKNLDVLSTPPSVQSRKRCLTKQSEDVVCSKRVKEQTADEATMEPTPTMVPEVGKVLGWKKMVERCWFQWRRCFLNGFLYEVSERFADSWCFFCWTWSKNCAISSLEMRKKRCFERTEPIY